MAWSTRELSALAQKKLTALADGAKAPLMQAYLKTDMPFYGVQNSQRQTVAREVKERFAPANAAQYEKGVKALWNLPRREEKYLALDYAQLWPEFITSASMPLFERLVREGAWWDLVDTVAIKLIGRVRLRERAAMKPTIAEWIDDEDFWIRRTAIISQIGHKKQTVETELFAHALRRAGEKEFFIRKAIGWALREYSKTAPEVMRDFLIAQRRKLSPLSFREGAKILIRQGLLEK